MSLSKPEFPSQLFSESFDLKLFLSLDLIRELVAIQHSGQTIAKLATYRSAWRLCARLPQAAEGRHGRRVPSGLEYTLRSRDAKGKKGMVLYKDAGGNRALFVAKSALSNHN